MTGLKNLLGLWPGYNVRPLEMSGAIGIEQIKKLPDFINVRRENASLFKSLFKDSSDFIIQKRFKRAHGLAFH